MRSTVISSYVRDRLKNIRVLSSEHVKEKHQEFCVSIVVGSPSLDITSWTTILVCTTITGSRAICSVSTSNRR